MKSISKSFGVPGLRLGILAGTDSVLINRLKKDVSIWNINSFAEFYLQIYNKYESFYKKACVDFVLERERMYGILSSISYLKVIPSQANFFLCKVLGGTTSSELTEQLLNDYNILIKDCDNKTGLCGKNYVRFAIRNKSENDRLIMALRCLSEKNK